MKCTELDHSKTHSAQHVSHNLQHGNSLRVAHCSVRAAGLCLRTLTSDGPMTRIFFLLGSLFALLAVAAGAFGAHALRARLTPDLLAVFETGARYQMYHAFALFVVAGASARWPARPVRVAGGLFVAGILVFSGSLYLLALTGERWLGAITPLGGLCFLAGWAVLALFVWRSERR